MGVVRTREPIVEGLEWIADFLNGIGPDTTEAQWKAFLRKRKPTGLITGPLFVWAGKTLRPVVTLDEAKTARQFIASDLRYLQFDREGLTTTEHPLGPLLVRLSTQFTAGTWVCEPLKDGRPDPGQAVLTLRRTHGRKERWGAKFVPFYTTRTLAEKCYAILGRALVNGALGTLRVCLHCEQYLVVSDERRQVHPSCKVDFQNRKREQGKRRYSKEWRERKREQQLVIARKLKRAGHPPRKIKAATKLPARVVEAVFNE